VPDAAKLTVADLRRHLIDSERALFEGIVARALAEAELLERAGRTKAGSPP
jgi:hypothetical protein